MPSFYEIEYANENMSKDCKIVILYSLFTKLNQIQLLHLYHL